MTETGIDAVTLKTELKNTFDSFINTLSLFTADEVNKVPFEGSWTAGQVTEHILKSLRALPLLLEDSVIAADRAPDEKCAAVRDLFLDFQAKFNSPESVLPTASRHDKGELITQLSDIKDQILAAVTTVDLSMLFTQFEFPGFGYLTRFEWFTFFAVHTQRHARQLKNIYEALTN